MKNTKTQFRLFSIVQWKQEEEYLRKQHKNGWKFTRVVFPGFYHFEKCIPEDVVYQLDFNPDGLAHKDSYVQIFRDCGWEYLKDFVGYSYFRKSVLEMNGDEEIFCDDASRLDMIKRVFKGRIIPLICLFLHALCRISICRAIIIQQRAVYCRASLSLCSFYTVFYFWLSAGNSGSIGN